MKIDDLEKILSGEGATRGTLMMTTLESMIYMTQEAAERALNEHAKSCEKHAKSYVRKGVDVPGWQRSNAAVQAALLMRALLDAKKSDGLAVRLASDPKEIRSMKVQACIEACSAVAEERAADSKEEMLAQIEEKMKELLQAAALCLEAATDLFPIVFAEKFMAHMRTNPGENETRMLLVDLAMSVGCAAGPRPEDN